MAESKQQPGKETAEEFSVSMKQKVLGGMVGLGIAMGMQTGLFEVMISLGERPRTSQEIADVANAKERYVREWLGCMATAGIVNFEPEGEKYWLPAHRANIMDLKGLALMVPILCRGFLQVAECFKKDGPSGIDYDKYPKLDEVLEKLHEPFFRDQFLQEFLPSMPKLLQQLRQGIQMLEVGCCKGDSLRMVATKFPNSHVYGLDISPAVIKCAQAKTKEMGLTNAEFVCEDVCRMPADWTSKFDYVFAYFMVHDLSYPFAALKEIFRVLKPDGTLSVVDTVTHSRLEDNIKDEHKDYILTQFTMSLMNCLPVSLYPGDGAGLGAIWGREKARLMLEEANFEVLSISATNAHLNGLHYMCRKPLHSPANNVCRNEIPQRARAICNPV